jgi:hypothetical protein
LRAGASNHRRSGRTGEKSCSAGNFGLAELGVWALSKTYLERLAIDELISRTSFRAPALNPIIAPGVLPHEPRRGLQSRCSAAAMSRPILSAVTSDGRKSAWGLNAESAMCAQ